MIETKVLSELAPAGHYVGLKLRFASPTIEINQLPRAWADQYAAQGLMLRDPVMTWVYEHTGVIRWSEIDGADPTGVGEAAAAHGLRFGTAVSLQESDEGGRSFGLFARGDRNHTDDELASLQAHFKDLHILAQQRDRVTKAECDVLRQVRDGARLKEVAHELDISESAVKARLLSAKRKLGARNSVHAVTLAVRALLI